MDRTRPGPPVRCSVCRHPDREAIDRLIVERAPYSVVAQRFGIPASRIAYHARTHEVVAAQQVAATRVLERAEQAFSHASEILTTVTDNDTKLEALREMHRALELVARLRGELGRDAASAAIRAELGSEVSRAREALELLGEAEGMPDAEVAARAQDYLERYNLAHPTAARYVRPRRQAAATKSTGQDPGNDKTS